MLDVFPLQHPVRVDPGEAAMAVAEDTQRSRSIQAQSLVWKQYKRPLRCPAGASIEVHMWRCVDKHKVWYEWALTGPQTTHLHNAKGRSFVVGL